jgi:hypothetical protein
MVLISYHWIHEKDGIIPAPLQSKSDAADRELSTAIARRTLNRTPQ